MGTPNTPDRPDRPHRPDAHQDLPNPEAALGGADSVEKTTYVTGSGTEPGGTERRGAHRGRPAARVGGGSMGIAGWALVIVVVAIALFFGASLFR